MKTINFLEMGVREMEMNDLMNTDGGMLAPLSSFAVKAIVTYIKCCIEVGNDYAAHHVQ
jgi:hypothetical protein